MDPKGLAQYAEQAYKATAGLMKLIPADKINWKPSQTNNWMTVGQLICHLSDSTGSAMESFVTGQWPPMPPDMALPTAEQMPTVSSVAEGLKKLEDDRRIMAKVLAALPEADFRGRMVTAPWNPTPMPLWTQLLLMVEHQITHKVMLFAYLKMLGVPVNTAHMYGMAG